MLRVLVVEDSATARELLVEILRSDVELQVAGEAKNGVEAVAMTKELHPDIVTMDIRMPLMDGFEATKRIMVEVPTPIVIVSASIDAREVEISMRALRAGALTIVARPMGPRAPDFEDARLRFLGTVKAMSQVKVVRHWPEREGSNRLAAKPRTNPVGQAKIVAIAASTGGPTALCEVLSSLPGDFPLPILVVQHIAQGFVSGFASWLTTNIALRAKVAEPGEPLRPRTIYIAPDGQHLGVRDGRTVLVSSAPALGGFRPSASFLFRSVAAVFGRSTLAIVLTGMGQDGLEGLYVVRQAGGQILAQDEQSSVVFGMPGMAVAAGLADATLPLMSIGPRILRAIQSDQGGP
jgi:two-component system, chemotaxis family, protein-glutamate methylesterase/glutaminase